MRLVNVRVGLQAVQKRGDICVELSWYFIGKDKCVESRSLIDHMFSSQIPTCYFLMFR